MAELTACCVLRSGGPLYEPRWVIRLRNNVRRFAPAHRFVALSDVDVPGVETIPLKHDWPRWWPILEVFRPGLFSGRVLYLDLADLVVWNMAPFFKGKGFTIAPDPWEPGPGRFASGVMAFDAGDSALYQQFVPLAGPTITRLHGDQDWITELRADAQTFDKRLCASYRGQCRDTDSIPRGARIVLCHGRPKPDVIREPWFRERWDRDWPA